MFRNLQRLAEQAATRQTRVEQLPFAQLLIAHQAAETNGVLVARRGPVEKRIVLERGVPVDCRSNLLHETLSRYLVEIGRIPEETAVAALARSSEKGALLGEVLIEEGLIDATELTRVLQQNLAKKLLDLFTWPDGEVALDDGPLPPFSALKVKVPQLVLTGVTRFMPQSAIDRAVQPLAAALLVRSPQHEAIAAELRLGARESEVLEALARPARIEELMRSTARGADELARSLYALLVLGLAISEEELRAAQPRASAEPAPAVIAALPATAPVAAPPAVAPPPRPDAAPAAKPAAPLFDDPVVLLELRNRVSQVFLAHRQKDAFDLLGVGEEAGAPEIQARFLAFAEEFAPARFARPGLESSAEFARELFLAGAAAYGLLADAGQRSELRTRRKMKREEAARTTRAAYHRIDTDLLDPALQFRKGMALKDAGKLKAALQQLEFAADCDPQNGNYRAEASRCRFLISPTVGGRQALEELKEAQRIDPKSVTALLYFAEIAGQLGQFDDAETTLRRAAKLLGPEDRRALDALHDLALLRKKKR